MYPSHPLDLTQMTLIGSFVFDPPSQTCACGRAKVLHRIDCETCAREASERDHARNNDERYSIRRSLEDPERELFIVTDGQTGEEFCTTTLEAARRWVEKRMGGRS